MTIGEANDLNALLRYLLKVEDHGIRTHPLQAIAAAHKLADKANKALSAGLSGADVERLWLAAAPSPANCPRRPAR